MSRSQRVIHPETEMAKRDAADLARLRKLSLEEHGRLLAMACRAAARIERSRVAGGMPRSQSIPWPDSTWEFLRKNAPHAND